MNFIRLKIQSKRLSILLLLIGFALAIVFANNVLIPFFPFMIVSLGVITAYVTLKDEMIWPLKLVAIVLDVLGVFKILKTFHTLS
jgi:4-hydroxybenzoate polyprenyltransferase